MPQPAQHLLTRVFLLWISILSIIQVVFIALYFTSGPHAKSQNYIATQQAMPIKANNQSLSDSGQKVDLGKGKMVTFKGSAGNGTIKWSPTNSPGIVKESGSVLTIDKDGYYFLNLQVTLRTTKGVCSLGDQSDPVLRVIHTNYDKKTTTLLEGRISNVTCTTGLLARVAELASKGTLEVTMNIQTPKINDSQSVTHLDIIYLSLQ